MKHEINAFLYGFDANKEIWGGVGVSCIEWNPIDQNILAAVTMKTNRLEIWDVARGQMISIMDLPKSAQKVIWNPLNAS